jgi:hypothetical protein
MTTAIVGRRAFHREIWTYAARKRIGSTSLGIKRNDMLALSIHFSGDLPVEAIFKSSKKGELGLVLQRLNI